MATATLAFESGTTVTPDNRDAWLAERENSLGASEAAAALGLSPYLSPIELWQRKLGLADPTEEPTDGPMYWGNRLEAVLIDEYQRRTGREVGDQQRFFRHPDHPFLSCTLDGRTHDGRIVEVKTAGAWAKGWDDEADGIPDAYLIQVHHQMAVTGATVADVAVLIGGQKFRLYEDIPRNDSLIEAVVKGGVDFWRHVEDREPPTHGKFTAQTLLAIHPDCQGAVTLDAETAESVAVYEGLGDKIKEFKDAREDYKVSILRRMGAFQNGTLPDGRIVRRYVQEVAERTQTIKGHTRHYFRVVKGGR